MGYGQGAYNIEGDEATRVASEGLPDDYDVISPDEMLPDEEKARNCLETSVWADYDDDWALRMMDTAHISPDEYQSVSGHHFSWNGVSLSGMQRRKSQGCET